MVNWRKVTYWLLLIGGINWGLYAFGLDLETWLPLGSGAYQVVYVAIGLSALWKLFGKGK